MSYFKDLRQAWAEINLSFLKDNYETLCRRIKPETAVMPVIKGNAYGHGAVEVARQLIDCGVQIMAVSNILEGIELRQSGIKIPILILEETGPQGAETVVEKHLTPAVCSVNFIRALARCAQLKQKKVKIHLRLDTSYGGTGVLPEEFELVARQLKEMPWLEVEGIFTHLYAAYTLNGDNVAAQLQVFDHIIARLRRLGMEIPMVHAASSPAILNYPEAHYTMVRPGIMLYGLPAHEGATERDFKPVMQLKGRIVSIKKLNSGINLGYVQNILVKRSLSIATIPLGYGDGFFLFLMKNGEVLVRGKRAPFFSRPCTGNFRVDVTEIKDAREGDEVVIFGEMGTESISAEEVARRAGIGVLNCETVCLLNHNLPRSYVKQDAFVANNPLGGEVNGGSRSLPYGKAHR